MWKAVVVSYRIKAREHGSFLERFGDCSFILKMIVPLCTADPAALLVAFESTSAIPIILGITKAAFT